MKKRILSLCLIFCLFSLSIIVANGANDSESQYVVERSEATVEDILGGAKVYHQSAKTYYDGYLDSTSKYYSLNPQTYQWVDLPATQEDVKIVTWSKGTIDSFHSSTTTATAKDWEENHPGWIVVAGANGDWFRINDTCEATNIMVQDGEVVRPVTFNSDWQRVLGWDIEGNIIEGVPTIDSYMSVHIYESKTAYTNDFTNEITKLKIAAYNTEPSEKGITLYTKDVEKEYDLTGYKVYVGQYDLCRKSYGSLKPFVKGTIKEISTTIGANAKPEVSRDNDIVREFYLVAKDGSLDNLLNTDNYVKCQFDLNGDWANIVSACGYVNQVLQNSQPMWKESCDAYGQYDEKTANKPRMIYGYKEDGSIVFMDIDGRNVQNGQTGLSCFEAGELMRLAGCTTAYNLDGGGSATLIVRNEYGDFDIVNTPSDGSERSIGNAILMVMRDPGIKFDNDNTTRNSVSFKKTSTLYGNLVSDIYITINGQTVKMENDTAIISGLEEDTEYIATVSYKIPSDTNDEIIQNGSFNVKVRTKAFEMPQVGFKISNINKTSFTISKNKTDTSSWFKDVQIEIDNEIYMMGDNDELTITGLFSETRYDLNISFNCVEPETGNKYPGSLKRTVTTLSYQIPELLSFEITTKNNRVTIAYEYTDDDSVVFNACLYLNNEEYLVLNGKKNTQTIRNLNLTENEYQFQIILTYFDESLAKEIKSEIITIGSKTVDEKYTIDYELDGGVNHQDNPTTYIKGTLIELNNPTKEGYDFKGWYLNDELVTEIGKDTTGNITLVAKWEERVATYIITYQLDGGTNNPSNPATYTNKESVTLADPTKEGYTFLGWYCNGEKITVVENNDITVVAKWEKVETKKGCSCKKSLGFVIMTLSIITLSALVLRKKH